MNCDDIKKEYGTIRMESDCRVHCIASIFKEAYKDRSKVQLLLCDLVRREHKLCFGNISDHLYGRYYLNEEKCNYCSARCKPDCNTRLYFTDINKIHDWSSETNEVYILNIKPGSIPHTIVRHSFEMTLMSFICNFGGLLGMWLGFSVLSISKHIFQSIDRLISFDGNKINLFINNNFNQNFFVKKSNASLRQNNLPMVEIN